MSQNMSYEPRLSRAGGKRPVTEADLLDQTLVAGNERTIYAKQVPQDKVYAAGNGGMDRLQGNGAHIFASIVDDVGNPVKGDLIVAITDSEQRRVLASTTVDTLGELADATTQERTERPLFPVLGPYAKPGRHIEFRIRAEPGSDGVSIDPAASDVRLYYTEIEA
ncbi:hypothetical protein [Halomarina oriensis]|uniref:Uncharacterized protein n=1 Tax=Halomarina oriensis TaxID=671145 RepID=A0A6B0GQJ9_9EURY|nr:hypothetical protein [Halomarina oriensis]MWG36950.1 hypothetical protein [Halomarina oriensis]